ncbi:MAG: alpha-L-fucosidase, partial [Pirellulaceae bacterium]
MTRMQCFLTAGLLTPLALFAAEPTRTTQSAATAKQKLVLTSPLDWQVTQRTSREQGELTIRGVSESNDTAMTALEGRLVGAGVPGAWQRLAAKIDGTQFQATIVAPAGGWYQVEVRALADEQVLAEAAVEHVGVGEVFVVAGQSNSANHGEEQQSPKSGLVAAFDGTRWQPANDPQPGASGGGGSFLPPFGDAIAERFHVPVGLIACGVGATSVREWLPQGARFPNPPTLLGNVGQLPGGEWESKGLIFSQFSERMQQLGPRGFRAVLWHQGESDANQGDPTRTLPGPLYQQCLEQLIRDSRREIGWEAPWFVAQVSYHVPGDESSPDIRAAQKALWDAGVALEGPDSDALRGELRENGGRGVHFSGQGLREHAARWADKVAPWLESQIPATEPQVLLPTAETPAQREARLAWWREARFGMFIHWGPCSVIGKEISWSRIGHPHDHPGLESVPPEEYDNLYKRFDPVQFDADAWMQLAADAGMKYVVLITKHHDGFSMWPTKLRPDYSIAATPFRRDICQEIADAAHKRGLKLGWYYSTRDWTHPDYLVSVRKLHRPCYFRANKVKRSSKKSCFRASCSE